MFFIVVLFCATAGFSQDNGKRKNREEMRKEIEEFKMKFIAQEMDLKEDQQKRFFELYSQMNEERSNLYKQIMKDERKLKKDPNASEEDYAAVSRAMTQAKEKDADLEKAYDEKFAAFLTNKQIYKMKVAEEKFRRKLQEMHHKKNKNRK